MDKEEILKIIESLSPNERKILPYIEEKNFSTIVEKSKIDKTSCLRALQFLSNKKIVNIKQERKKIIDLGINGINYKKTALPERKLLNYLYEEKKPVLIEEAKEKTKLNNNEIKIAIGTLKEKNMIEIKNGNIFLIEKNSSRFYEKFPEEKFLEKLPLEEKDLSNEEKKILSILKKRKQIIEERNVIDIKIEITELGKKIIKESSYIREDYIESVTPEVIKKEEWKNKKFRRYDIKSKVPSIYGGKKHFVNQAIEYARKIWIEMGFEEMTSNLIVESFWNFDALFTPQDHPVREMQDSFFLPYKKEIENKKIVEVVKKAHEKGVNNSKGWNYEWDEEEAKKLVLRTHTTTCSALALSKLKKEDLPKKYFAIGKCFRNETLDINHLFELTQTEGIVVDENVNLRHLIGYLTEFYKKMGYEKIRVRPSYFPYTEPSLEIEVYDKKQKKWIELGGAGIFRPEVVVPLLGKYIPVLAWGQGFERIIREYFEIEDLRDMYSNDLNKLRNMKLWIK
ncbi:MAG: phenylalanine--tRNA ligase subunit alpha [Candidatus Pacearchaeota archaeon]